MRDEYADAIRRLVCRVIRHDWDPEHPWTLEQYESGVTCQRCGEEPKDVTHIKITND